MLTTNNLIPPNCIIMTLYYKLQLGFRIILDRLRTYHPHTWPSKQPVFCGLQKGIFVISHIPIWLEYIFSPIFSSDPIRSDPFFSLSYNEQFLIWNNSKNHFLREIERDNTFFWQKKKERGQHIFIFDQSLEFAKEVSEMTI